MWDTEGIPMEEYLSDREFGFRKACATMDATGMIMVIAKNTVSKKI